VSAEGKKKIKKGAREIGGNFPGIAKEESSLGGIIQKEIRLLSK
jgi:hypothetical protein